MGTRRQKNYDLIHSFTDFINIEFPITNRIKYSNMGYGFLTVLGKIICNCLYFYFNVLKCYVLPFNFI